jgi:hypothetical protein
LLTNGTASAEQVEGGGRQVVFTGGGMLGLSCRSAPSVNSLTVPENSTIAVVNRTGHSAQLALGGANRGTVEDNGAAEVVFRRGTTAVTLTPTCALGNQSLPVLVTAMPAAAGAMPDPIPAPSGSTDSPEPAAKPADPAGTGSSTSTGSSLPDASGSASAAGHPSAATAGKPGATRTAATRALAAASSAAATQSMPLGGSVPTRLTPRTLKTKAGGLGPAFAGMPPGDSKAIVSGVPTLSLPSVTDAAPAAGSAPSSEVTTAEPVASLEPLSDNRPNGLLAVIAIVCTLGVAVGAIRAFVSQRASRTTIA